MVETLKFTPYAEKALDFATKILRSLVNGVQFETPQEHPAIIDLFVKEKSPLVLDFVSTLIVCYLILI